MTGARTGLHRRISTTKQLAELLRAVAGHNMPRAVESARRIAQVEADKGNHSAARDLLGSLNGYATPEHAGHSHPVAQSVTAQQCVSFLSNAATLDSLELPVALREEITELSDEWRHRAELRALGIPRRWRLLVHGPPGCGKSATAAALGGFGVREEISEAAIPLPTFGAEIRAASCNACRRGKRALFSAA